jgi:hypothetical protein
MSDQIDWEKYMAKKEEMGLIEPSEGTPSSLTIEDKQHVNDNEMIDPNVYKNQIMEELKNDLPKSQEGGFYKKKYLKYKSKYLGLKKLLQ